MESYPITPAGMDMIKKEERLLEQEKLPALIQELEIARGFGDLSENAEYHSVKERLYQTQKRLSFLKKAIALAQIIDVASLSGTNIMFGATVQLICNDTKKNHEYQIVGDAESNTKENKISILSAIARGLIGKKEGDDVSITTPGGVYNFHIKNVCYK